MPSFAKNSTSTPAGAEVLPMLDAFRVGDADAVLEKHKNSIRSRALAIVQTALPAFVEHLQHLLDAADVDESSMQFPEQSRCSEKRVPHDASLLGICQPGPTDDPEGLSMGKVTLDDDGVIPGVCWLGELPANPFCDRVLNIVRVEGQKYYILMQDLRTWTRLEKPTIEDGGNFGVGVQEKVSNQIKNDLLAADEARCLGSRNYHPERIKKGAVWCRYPKLKDHATALKLFDEHFFLKSRLEIVKLQSLALQQLNNLRNNWVKVCDPKGRQGKERSSTFY
ncbi:hypothetical protein QFC22_006184 [Naganishia vaughanmartiniae]|uniref:Uncharacterized protein n=1 Tax=Naganishia vaughanmartiniae TaxID=1424756 RepID=A0ACC2WQ67_9TREE|nr:hypothetical protein QFC22_006184 [Naganishia vaughanmartiniae]